MSREIVSRLEEISATLGRVDDCVDRTYRLSIEQSNKPRPWGKEDLMVLAAFRYCVGRRTYIVPECVEWLFVNWPEFSDSIKGLIQKELEELFDQDDLYRAGEWGDYRPLGDNCDRQEWERVRALWE